MNAVDSCGGLYNLLSDFIAGALTSKLIHFKRSSSATDGVSALAHNRANERYLYQRECEADESKNNLCGIWF
jgi:hypothetical protein